MQLYGRMRMMAGALCRVLWPAAGFARQTLWEKYLTEARRAYRRAAYGDSEELLRNAVSLAEESWPQSSSLAEKLHQVADVYESLLGKYDEAEALYLRSLALKEETLGLEHLNLAPTLNTLALLYHHQRRSTKAEPLFQRALAIVEKALGPEHPEYATCLQNYAALLRATDRAQEASQALQRAKSIRAQRGAGS